jgi:hypothetical protein
MRHQLVEARRVVAGELDHPALRRARRRLAEALRERGRGQAERESVDARAREKGRAVVRAVMVLDRREDHAQRCDATRVVEDGLLAVVRLEPEARIEPEEIAHNLVRIDRACAADRHVSRPHRVPRAEDCSREMPSPRLNSTSSSAFIAGSSIAGLLVSWVSLSMRRRRARV